MRMDSRFVFLVLFTVTFAQYCTEVPNCNCTVNTNNELSYDCSGESLANITSSLPPVSTVRFRYIAFENRVDLVSANLSQLVNLKTLQILPSPNSSLYIQRMKDIESPGSNVLPSLQLRELMINVPWRMTNPLPALFEGMKNLEKLDLSHTRFMNIANLILTISGLRSNTKLTYLNLWNVLSFEFADPSLKLDLQALLIPLSNAPLRYLNIGYNALRQIHPVGLLIHAQHLEEIIVSNNMLIPLITSALFMEIIMHPTLNKVHMSQQLFRPDRMKRSSPGGISGQNRCALFDDDPQMEALRLAFATNHTFFCSYLYQSDASLFRTIPCHMIPPFNSFAKKECAGCNVVPFTGSIKQLFMSQLNIYDEVPLQPGFSTRDNCFNRNNSLEFLDLSNNHDFGWIGITDAVQAQVLGFEKIKKLLISNCGIVNMNPFLLVNFPMLEVLDLASNFMQVANSSLFSMNPDLLTINLSNNEIHTLDKDIFLNLLRLEHLDLSNNKLLHFQVEVSNLVNIKTIQLSGNRIKTFDVDLIKQINSLVASTNLSINLKDNSLICTCQTVEFIRWSKQLPPGISMTDSNTYLCANQESKLEPLLDISIAAIDKECNIFTYYIIISIASTLAVVFVLIIIIVVYKKRWRIRYFMFLAKTMWDNKIHNEYARFKYDAFISYNVEDRFWVHDFLRPVLENKKGLKLCLHYRDFLAGEIIEEQVLTAIEQSHKTVLILSPNFLKSRWCFFELQMARNRLFQHGIDVLILVILSPLPLAHVPRSLANIMEEKVYIEWTPDPDGQKIFWTKLEQAIRTPRKNVLPVNS